MKVTVVRSCLHSHSDCILVCGVTMGVDSIETTMGGQWYDALVALPGCDKNMPGCLIAMGRLNRPALMIYGGTIRAGCTEKFPQVDSFRWHCWRG